jgi:hypothetical protein
MNATMIMHVAPGPNVAPQVVPMLSTTKPAEAVIVRPVAVADDDSLVTVTVCGALVVLTG